MEARPVLLCSPLPVLAPLASRSDSQRQANRLRLMGDHMEKPEPGEKRGGFSLTLKIETPSIVPNQRLFP